MRFTPADYTELLGFYLGDGCISQLARTMSLRVTLDAKYPRLIADLVDLLRRCFPTNSVDVTPRRKAACQDVWVYSRHLACLFPQHGPGKKHERRVVLEEWQSDLVAAAPWRFLRGCIRSDGSVFVNRTGPYGYLSYDFSNLSKDLIEMFTATCDLVGLDYRVNRWRRAWHVRINRRGSVALMLEHVGVKE